ncbi:TolC family protein [Parabacteroides faecis]|uniref:TolC family protein n=1 Tax=Parabacteroides faecis TaxID=1217282 RepID=UPI0021643760|nr:TolC family protein [Parabacteroides faecis]MCS2889888.1 TolC family protein [Parabacteroides faecis]UVQ46412.1 TolC family protein [Parabacteroides faecis]
MNKKDIVILCCVALFSVPGVWAQQPLRLSLGECRKMALAHNEALQQADNTLRQAELDRQIAKTAFLPKFDASAVGAYMLPDMDMLGMEMRMRGTYMAGVNLTQPIYTGGKITTGNRLARIGEEVATEQVRMTRMDVLVEADNAYWTYIAVGRKVRMLESYHAQMDTLHRQTEAALAAGMATENDLLRIDAKRTEIHYQLQKVQNGADLCRMSLCRIVGADFDTQIEAIDTIFVASQPVGLSAETAARPELHLLEKQIAAGKEQIRMARADMLPTVALTANYMYYGNIKLNGMTDAGGTMIPFSQEFRDGIGMAMLSVQIPIFHWGENRKKVRKARYELRNAELDLQKNTRLLNIEVQQAIRNVQDGYGLIRTAEKGLRQADENLRVMRNRHAASMASLTDLLDAQSQWQQAESNLIEAQTQYKIYETEYLRATGRLDF